MSKAGRQAGEIAQQAEASSVAKEYEDIVRELSSPPASAASPLSVLQAHIKSVLKYGNHRGGAIFFNIEAAAKTPTITVVTPTVDNDKPWASCLVTATIVGLFACPEDQILDTVDFQDRSLYDEPMTRPKRIDALRSAYEAAKANAIDPQAMTTVLLVTLNDVHDRELLDTVSHAEHTSFSHTFALGIGPEGMIVWQSWAAIKWHYTLEDHLTRDGTRVRSWSEADAFVDKFVQLAMHQGGWNKHCNDLYEELFSVDMLQLCGADGPLKLIVSKYEAWINFHVIKDVRIEHLQKFKFSSATGARV